MTTTVAPTSISPKVALVHDWLNGMRGGEKVFEAICEIFPQADVFTLFYEPAKVSPRIRAMNVHESPVARLFPRARRRYRYLLPLLPKAAEALPIAGGDYDLVISTSHCVAKGIRAGRAVHICYCFTPMRYVWEKYDDYFGNKRKLASWVMPFLRRPLQRWDVKTATPERVHHFLTSSEYMRDRIQRHYGREATVIAPPVDYGTFAGAAAPDAPAPKEYFLTVSALEPYKRVDLAVEAFRKLGLPLKVAGSGSEASRLRASAPSNVEFLGWVPDVDLPKLYAGARALVFPPDEDFGIVPLEAAAAGTPTIAFGHGGSLETVRDGADGSAPTGVFFREQTVDSVIEAVEEFVTVESAGQFSQDALQTLARRFDRAEFLAKMRAAIANLAFG